MIDTTCGYLNLLSLSNNDAVEICIITLMLSPRLIHGICSNLYSSGSQSVGRGMWIAVGQNFTHRILLGEEHADVVCTGISTKAVEELIDLSDDSSFKVSFDRKTLIQFWLSVGNTYPTRSTAA
ncbi:hypothetical protein T07_11134 [Trichinella nelsoni]|uniref:Uncharacterized protein n=1 Tax=Trichinella nelsoni TaxID=6336 RepID=A0A0V0S9P7_9BILA|nr:hypothetical protein T07_11134 [Trichinella nelsoni]